MVRAEGLRSLIEDYVLFRSLQDCSTYQLDRSARIFEAWLERPASPEDFDDRTVSNWLLDLSATYAQRTVADHRTNLLRLWRFAAESGLCSPPFRVRRVKRPEPLPIAWSMNELRAIMIRCGQLTGHFRLTGAQRDLYASTLVKFCYESGLRRSDVWITRRDQIRDDGTILLRQHKTQDPHFPRLRADTVAAIAELPGKRPLACPFASASYFYKWWRSQVIKPAGVRHGALQQIRRTGATHLAIEHPESVQRFLGHRTASMARHYVDQSLANPQQHLPPAI